MSADVGVRHALAAPQERPPVEAELAIDAADTGSGGVGVPRDTTPTWEIELLVSGIVLVGLLQVPPWLHDVWQRRELQASPIGAVAGHTALLAVDAALYALIGCFLIHLALRGYWVALVGANSVFPRGVRWERQREYGPIQAELMQSRVRPLPSYIARTDNAASLVFATGFVLAANALASLAFIAVLIAIVWALSSILPLTLALAIFLAIAALFSVALFGAMAVDFRRGATLARGGHLHRLVAATLRLASGITPGGVRSLGAVLTSNLDKRVVYGAMLVIFGGAYAAAFAAMRDNGALPGASNFRFFAEDARPGVVSADNYDALRTERGGAPTAPSIQSDVITDPYVRLFIPYRVAGHGAALARACPGLRPPPSEGGEPGADRADEAVLACAARVHAVSLDGRAVSARFRFFTNPRTERRGFLMLIPTASLAPGEHVIALRPALRDPSPADTVPIRIPFWR